MHEYEAASDISRRVAVWLKRQPGVGEESLTDWLLFELAERIPRVRYVKFNRVQEGRTTGADWEWWFVYSNLSLGMRVQAKRLHSREDNYPSLAYSTKHGMQIEKLRKDATARNLLAFYAFYSADPGPIQIKCGRGLGASAGQGTFLASANGLYSEHIHKGRAAVTAVDILRACNPLPCLFNCPATEHYGGAEGLYHYFESYFPEALAQDGVNPGANRPGEPRLGLHDHDSLPGYLSSMLRLDNEVPDWWEGEHRPPSDEVKALLVFDFRRNGA